MTQPSEPFFNIPPVVLGVLLLLAVTHAVRVLLLPPAAEFEFLLNLAFIPARYGSATMSPGLAGLPGAEVWSFISYALVHADWFHLGMNAVWFLPFGSALARRIGPMRFLVFLAVTAAAGAAAHLATHFGALYPMVGASAAISGTMAGAMRFVFQGRGPLAGWHAQSEAAYRLPAAPLAVALRDGRVLAFIGVWFGINILFGLGGLEFGSGQAVAWEAHIGGFVAGLLLFPLFDPVPRQDASAPDSPQG